jgi:hypothetical protein
MHQIAIICSTLADFSINVSAGWFGLAFITPITIKGSQNRRILLTRSILFAIVSLGIAIGFRNFV